MSWNEKHCFICLKPFEDNHPTFPKICKDCWTCPSCGKFISAGEDRWIGHDGLVKCVHCHEAWRYVRLEHLLEEAHRLKDPKIKNKKVFLGGTCNNSTWREKLIPQLKINHFNPVVDDWNPAAQVEEIRQRQKCDFCLYVITPKMTGAYAIAEVADDSNKRPTKTIFCFLPEDEDKTFTEGQKKSLAQVGNMVRKNGARWLPDLEEVAKYLNREGSRV